MRLILALRAILIVTIVLGSIAAKSQKSGMANDHHNALDGDCSPALKDCSEEWTGIRTYQGRSQAILLHVVQSNSRETATVDLPDFGALDIPASQFAMNAGRVHFELVGDSSTTVFDGNVSGDAIHGSWRDGERAGDFELKHAHEANEAFRAENVSFKNGDVRLAGTLLLPDQSTPAPVIVFVQGAGPERRYASRFMAEFFVKRGVAALIYDKRGTGDSSGDWKHSSFEALAGDVTASVAFLRSRREIDPHRIGLMGSSQGGWIAPMAALRTPDIAFVIVKSAAAVTPEQQELARVEIQMRAEGDSSADISRALHLYRHAIAYANSGEGWQSLEREIKTDSEEKWAFFSADIPKDDPFFDQIRLFFHHDPIPVLKQLKSPLLVIFGGEDDDGPPLQSQLGTLLEAMRAGGKQSELVVFPNAGHDLRVVPEKGQAWDFGRFAPGYLDTLASWVKAETK